jgi:hypothetical protein
MIAGQLVFEQAYCYLGLLGPWDYYKCANCSTSFPEIDGEIRCNGHAIELCPWCRADSAPWRKGRGR